MNLQQIRDPKRSPAKGRGQETIHQSPKDTAPRYSSATTAQASQSCVETKKSRGSKGRGERVCPVAGQACSRGEGQEKRAEEETRIIHEELKPCHSYVAREPDEVCGAGRWLVERRLDTCWALLITRSNCSEALPVQFLAVPAASPACL